MSAGIRLLSIGSVLSAVIGGSLLHPLVTGAASSTTHQGAAIGVGLVPAATAFTALALLLGLLAYRDHIPAVDRVLSSTTTKRATTVAVAALVVTTVALSGVGGPASPTGTATAQTGFINPACGNDLGELILTLAGAQDICNYEPTYTQQDVNNLTSTDNHAAALSLQAGIESATVTRDNFAQDTRSVAMAKAYEVLVSELNNGSSVAAAKDAANQTVESYYVTHQKNIIEDWNARVAHLRYMDTVPNVSVDWHTSTEYQMNGSLDQNESWSTNGDYGANVELIDGSKKFSRALDEQADPLQSALMPWAPVQYHSNTYDRTVYNESERQNDDLSPWRYTMGNGDGYGGVDVVTNEGTTRVLHADNDYHAQWNDYISQNTQVQENAAILADELFAAYDAGEIDMTDVADSMPLTLASQAATDYNETGYYGFANTQLAALGLGGDTNASHVIETTRTVVNETSATTETQNVSITGTLFYTGDDGQVFNTSETYDPSTLSGAVYITVSSMTNLDTNESVDSDGFFHVTDSFTIASATNVRTGASLNETTMEVRDYNTTNLTEMQEAIDDLREIRDSYEREQAAAGIGSSGGNDTILIAAIALAAGAALMYRRDDD